MTLTTDNNVELDDLDQAQCSWLQTFVCRARINPDGQMFRGETGVTLLRKRGVTTDLQGRHYVTRAEASRLRGWSASMIRDYIGWHLEIPANPLNLVERLICMEVLQSLEQLPSVAPRIEKSRERRRIARIELGKAPFVEQDFRQIL